MTSKLAPRCGILDLDEEALHYIFSYLVPFADLISVAGTCSYLRSAALKSRVWGDGPTDICISANCFGCGRIRGSSAAGLRVCRESPLNSLRMHINFGHLQPCVRALVNRGTVRKLHLRLEPDITRTIFKYDATLPSFTKLTSLTIYRWPSGTKGPPDKKNAVDCIEFLRQVGAGLLHLKCMESTPQDLLTAIAAYCPMLRSLVIEGSVLTASDLASYRSATLQELVLNNVLFVPKSTLHLPQLTCFELSSNTVTTLPRQIADVDAFIEALPESITELTLSVCRTVVDAHLSIIGQRLHALRILTLHVVEPFEHGVDSDSLRIGTACVQKLRDGCPHLRSFEVSGGDMGFEPDAFLAIGTITSLRRLKIASTASVLRVLPQYLQRAEYLEELIFCDNAVLCRGMNTWSQLEERLEKISEAFPAVVIRLEDQWWNLMAL